MVQLYTATTRRSVLFVHERPAQTKAQRAPLRSASRQAVCSSLSAKAPDLLLEGVRVVLVSPKTPANIGAVLRVAENFEAHDLCVVDPRCDPLCEEVRIVSCGSQVLDCMTVVPSLQQALHDVSCSVGFTRRAGAGRVTHPSITHLLSHYPTLLPQPLLESAFEGESVDLHQLDLRGEPSLQVASCTEQFLTSASRQQLGTVNAGSRRETIIESSSRDSFAHVKFAAQGSRAAAPAAEAHHGSFSGGARRRERLALVFGREESGLLEGELLQCSHACSIPTGRSQPSLNLSHAVAVVLAQLFEAQALQHGGVDLFEGERSKFVRQQALSPANQGELESLLVRWAALLESAGISTRDSTGGGDKGNHGRRKLVMGHLRSLLLRGRVSTAEVRSLHGLAKDLEACLRQ